MNILFKKILFIFVQASHANLIWKVWALLEKRATAFLVAEITKTVTISCTCGVREPLSFAAMCLEAIYSYTCVRVPNTAVIEGLRVDGHINHIS